MRGTDRDDLLDAALALLAAGAHVGMALLVDRPPELDLSLVFVGLPVLLSVVAAGALLAGERRPLQAACLWTWLMVLFTLPARGLGLAWVPSAVLLSVALARPRLSSGRAATG